MSVTILLASTLAVVAQTSAPRPAFEVASIKLITSNEGSDSEATPGRLRIQGTLRSLIRIAYGVRPDQVEGGPSWVDQDHYAIDAKSEGPAETPELLQMLQTLLADRFQLQFHHEVRSVSGYALSVAKGGIRMKAASGSSHTMHGGSGNLTAENVDMPRIATRLAAVLGSPVADETGVSGLFSFTLKWAPDKGSLSPGASELDNAGPSLFTAVQEQLGLRLEGRKVPVDMLVVNRAARPSLN